MGTTNQNIARVRNDHLDTSSGSRSNQRCRSVVYWPDYPLRMCARFENTDHWEVVTGDGSMAVPWRKRFRVTFDNDGWRFSLRLVAGFFIFYVSRKWQSWYTESTFISEVTIGWIPWNVKEGQTVPAWKLYHREEHLKQI